MHGPKLVTSEQMRRVDQQSIHVHGIPGHELMDHAGERVVEAIGDRWNGLQGLRVAVVCGKGNNGGDGLVVARRLKQAGAGVDLFLLEGPQLFGADARIHFDRLQEAELLATVLPATDTLDFSPYDLIVDAILGIGIKGPPREYQAAVIDAMNQSERPIVAVDLPSGLDADTGSIHGVAIKASLTVTFGLPKIAHLFHPARELCGSLALTDIGFPQQAIDECPSRIHLLTTEQVGPRIPRRSATAHKGTVGSVGVIAGSAGMTGAAALTAQAALRAGAGRVRLGCPASLHDILEIKVTEAMTHSLPELRRQRCLSLRGLGATLELLKNCQAAAMGPGLGRASETMELVRRLLQKDELPALVIDADALYAIGHELSQLRSLGAAAVLTPHAGEMARLLDCTAEQIRREPMEAALGAASASGLVVLLKGAPTVIADPDGRIFVNPTGNSGMASAGTGDVLAGLIAGLLAQGSRPLEAACVGAFLHGAAGDLCRQDLGEWGMTAQDLVDHLPASFLNTYRASVNCDRS